MSNKKLRTLAALTSALLFVNAGAGTFVANAAGSGSFVTVDGDSNDSSNSHVSIFGGEYATLPQIEGEEEYGIRIAKSPAKTEYLIGEELDISDIRISGYCNTRNEDGKLLTIHDFLDKDLQAMIDNGTVEINTDEFYNSRRSGVRSIYIYYGKAETKFDVFVENPDEYSSLKWDVMPEKTEYLFGEELDFTGAKVSGSYTDGMICSDIFNADLQSLIDSGKIEVEATDFYNNATTGTRTIYLYYYDAEIEFDVEVTNPHEYYSLNICKPPTKTVYQLGEELDITGTKIQGTYGNGLLVGDIFPTDLAPYLEKGMITLDDSEFDNTKAGTYTIYIHYGTATDSFEVTVVEASESITTTTTTSAAATTTTTTTTPVFEITTTTYQAPSYSYNLSVYPYEESETIYKLGEELDFSGICVHGYGGGDDYYADIPYISLDKCSSVTIDASEFDNTKPGTYTIYVKWYDAVDSFEVTVLDTPALTKGDANGDGEFTIADMVSVQNNLLGKKTAKLADWRAADLYPDGKIDVYDFIVMRSEFVKNFK